MKQFVLTSFLVSLLSIYCQAQQRQFQLNLKEGEEYKLKLRSRIKTVHSGGKQNIFGVEYQYSFLVTNHRKNIFEMDVKQLSATVAHRDEKDGGFSGTTETSNPKSKKGPLTEVLNEFQEKIFKMKIDKYGKVLTVEGYNEICEAIRRNFTEKQKAIDALSASLELNLNGMMTNDEFGKRIQEVFLFIPTEKVRVGDTWSRTVNTGIEFFNFNVDMQYKFSGISDKTSTVEGKALISHNQKSEFISGADEALQQTGTITTTIIVNNDSGWIESTEQVNIAEGTATSSKGETTQIDINGQFSVNRQDPK